MTPWARSGDWVLWRNEDGPWEVILVHEGPSGALYTLSQEIGAGEPAVRLVADNVPAMACRLIPRPERKR